MNSDKSDKPLIRNLNLSIFQSFFLFPAFWVPVIGVFLESERSIEPALALSFFSAYNILVLLLEIPTGIVADKHSRRLSLILGYLALAGGYITLLSFSGVISLVVFILLTALGASLVSGANQSIVYDSLDDLGRSDEFIAFNTKIAVIAMGSSAIYSMIGGWLGDINIYIPILLSGIFSGIAGLITFFFKEPEVSERAAKLNQSNYLKHAFASLKKLFSKESVRSGLLIMVTMFAVNYLFQSGMKYIIQYIFPYKGINLSLTGTAISGFLVMLGLSPLIFVAIWKKQMRIKGIIASLMIPIAMYLLFAFSSPYILIAGCLAVGMAAPIITSITEQQINDLIETKERATILSMKNMVARGMSGLGIFLFGYLLDYWSLTTAIVSLIAWAMVLLLMYFYSDLKFRKSLYK